MKKQYLLITAAAILFSSLCSYGQSENKIYSAYDEMRGVVVSNFRDNKFEEAITILNLHLEIFPDNLVVNTYNLALCYGKLEQYKDGVKALMNGIKNDVWFNKWGFEGEFWNPYKELEEFQNFIKINESKRLEAQKYSKSDMLIVKPNNYDETKKYPLFFALHGGGGTMDGFQKLWKSDLMQNEYIVAYLQSSQPISMNGYTWDDMEIASFEITEAYNKILKDYLIDTNEIVIGGFSAGGRASLATIAKTNIPYAGFIVLSPAMPEDFTVENVKYFKEKDIRGTIISNSKDHQYKDQRHMSAMFKENGMQYQFIETSDIGHWFPENLDVLIDQSIQFIRNR